MALFSLNPCVSLPWEWLSEINFNWIYCTCRLTSKMYTKACKITLLFSIGFYSIISVLHYKIQMRNSTKFKCIFTIECHIWNMNQSYVPEHACRDNIVSYYAASQLKIILDQKPSIFQFQNYTTIYQKVTIILMLNTPHIFYPYSLLQKTESNYKFHYQPEVSFFARIYSMNIRFWVFVVAIKHECAENYLFYQERKRSSIKICSEFSSH